MRETTLFLTPALATRLFMFLVHSPSLIGKDTCSFPSLQIRGSKYSPSHFSSSLTCIYKRVMEGGSKICSLRPCLGPMIRRILPCANFTSPLKKKSRKSRFSPISCTWPSLCCFENERKWLKRCQALDSLVQTSSLVETTDFFLASAEKRESVPKHKTEKQ